LTYIAALLAVAVIGVGLAATGMVWSQARQREKEEDLLFIGDQFRQAIAFYYERTPGAIKRYPEKLENLLEDKRYPDPQRYLRKIYPDPMTGKPEWGLVAGPGGSIMGVYSLSNAAPIKVAGFDAKNRTLEGATTYYEWRFIYEPPPAKVPAAISATPPPVSEPQAPAVPMRAIPTAAAPGAPPR
jgi:type II secretory pathway pseudopilin PulG